MSKLLRRLGQWFNAKFFPAPLCYQCKEPMTYEGSLNGKVIATSARYQTFLYSCGDDGIGRITGTHPRWLTSTELEDFR